MVAVDARGKPSPVPRLIPETAQERERFFQAEARRKARLKRRS
jgi:acyl-CoA hydrolase